MRYSKKNTPKCSLSFLEKTIRQHLEVFKVAESLGIKLIV